MKKIIEIIEIFFLIPVVFWVTIILMMTFMRSIVPVAKALSGVLTDNPKLLTDWEIIKLYLILQGVWCLFFIGCAIYSKITAGYYFKIEK